MKLLLQRVAEAAVDVDGACVGRIGQGVLVFVCAEPGDTEEDAAYLARKVVLMRIFSDDDGKMNRSVADIGGAVLAVSQFTLAARWKKGNRPGFSDAAEPELGKRLYEHFCEALRSEGVPVETGRFAAEMKVSLVNDGPITIWMDSRDPR
ncbi:D-aminoacyl-tRNA deacylase [Hwanghaeella sp.]|uniref:D-aminoacyl-tRNA deacylase n=1 Tax=Hwanghaeella sp. TaxID=2605943 RepID=UPI003CCC35C8